MGVIGTEHYSLIIERRPVIEKGMRVGEEYVRRYCISITENPEIEHGKTLQLDHIHFGEIGRLEQTCWVELLRDPAKKRATSSSDLCIPLTPPEMDEGGEGEQGAGE